MDKLRDQLLNHLTQGVQTVAMSENGNHDSAVDPREHINTASILGNGKARVGALVGQSNLNEEASSFEATQEWSPVFADIETGRITIYKGEVGICWQFQGDKNRAHVVSGLFKVLSRVRNMAYNLDLPSNMKIHSTISTAQLEPAPREDDPYQHLRPHHRPPVVDTDLDWHEYEVEKRLRALPSHLECAQVSRKGPLEGVTPLNCIKAEPNPPPLLRQQYNGFHSHLQLHPNLKWTAPSKILALMNPTPSPKGVTAAMPEGDQPLTSEKEGWSPQRSKLHSNDHLNARQAGTNMSKPD